MTDEVKKNRRSLILLLLVFVVPILLAKLALDYQWFNYGVTNQGRLLEQKLKLTNLGLSEAQGKQWLIIYALPDNCDEQCELTLSTIENTYFALGRETPRVTPVAVSLSPFNAEQLTKVNNNHWQFVSELTATSKPNQLSSEQIYIADPLGNVVLTYPQPTGDDAVLSLGKAMLSDLKKLLKYSRIG
ncbi:hypothetical protein QWY77_05870 [Thalassotalea ponticola]|uniref:hypothetical protein n=1 Tax=Thalassotalea ponticola TaxID=1523392 RepID=UPI0025B38773|nr:hypothetical protein [Thalassotalea ponticola]MDN3652286.1 hypothetical protein [Thalassotalea ponticola]